MLSHSLIAFAVVAAHAFDRPSSSQADPETFTGTGIYFEEDSIVSPLFPATDRNYTGGAAFRFSGGWVQDVRLSAPLEFVDGALGVERLYEMMNKDVREQSPAGLAAARGWSFLFGMTLFTPFNLALSDPNIGRAKDRPYASLEFISTTRTYVGIQRGVALTSELVLGMLGMDAAHQVQSQIHLYIRGGRQQKCPEPGYPTTKDTPPHEPCGWRNQISDGGEPTFLYALNGEKEILSTSNLLFADLKATGRASVGYDTALTVGLAARVGLIDSGFWSYSTAPLASTNQLAQAGNRDLRSGSGGDAGAAEQEQAECPPTKEWHPEIYAWGAVRARGVLYNALLQGQVRDLVRHSKFTFSFDEMSHGMLEYEAGITGTLGGLRLTWAAIEARTPEFQAGDNVRRHAWTSFFLSWDKSL